ncbi:MmcQ/YjbR family DNA-binding protein [Caulobacter sp.]|uniref:MmcQ/YjbR family DNA-binding protein n=1 Tax=Caulobacter sp. TaxID=78 RepID=UPI003BAEE8DD
MIDPAKIRCAMMALPEVEAGECGESLTFSVRGKGLSWPYLARATPKGRREAAPGVLAVRCRPEKKALLLEAAPEVFFEDDHYRGYPAVLVRLDAVGEDELTALLTDAWRLQAPKPLVRRFEAGT